MPIAPNISNEPDGDFSDSIAHASLSRTRTRSSSQESMYCSESAYSQDSSEETIPFSEDEEIEWYDSDMSDRSEHLTVGQTFQGTDLKRASPIPLSNYGMIRSESFDLLQEAVDKNDDLIESALVRTRGRFAREATQHSGESNSDETKDCLMPAINEKGFFQKKRRFTLEPVQTVPLSPDQGPRTGYVQPTRPGTNYADPDLTRTKAPHPAPSGYAPAPKSERRQRREERAKAVYGTYVPAPEAPVHVRRPSRDYVPPSNDQYYSNAVPNLPGSKNVQTSMPSYHQPPSIGKAAKMPTMKMPLQHSSAVDPSRRKSKKNKASKHNPYEGHTPSVHADVVAPNADGIYAFSPSAAAFKWNWSLLDVRKRPMGGMTPFGAPTPANAFGRFREDFGATPAKVAQAPTCSKKYFLEVGPSRSSASRRLTKKMERDGLPEFPSGRRPCRAVRKRNLEFTPGGHYGGKTAESGYRPIYDGLVSKGGAEPSNFQIEGKEIVQLNDVAPYRPSVRLRGQIHRSSSSHSVTGD